MVKPIYKLLLSFSALALASCTPAPQPEAQGPDGAVMVGRQAPVVIRH